MVGTLVEKRVFEYADGGAELDRIAAADGYGHHLAAAAIEQLTPLARPDRLRATVV
jgi:hypothetical protein